MFKHKSPLAVAIAAESLLTSAAAGAVFALTYVVSYLAFSVPAVVAGVAANVVGLGPTATVYGGVVAALGVVALVARLRLRRQDFRATPA